MSKDKEKGLSVLSASVWPLESKTPNIFSFTEVLGSKETSATSQESDEDLGEVLSAEPAVDLDWD